MLWRRRHALLGNRTRADSQPPPAGVVGPFRDRMYGEFE
jgi:hypothetical protein